jgi:RNA-splicing ligase RtcB
LEKNSLKTKVFQSYTKANRGWVTREMFTAWFHESFEPTLKTFLKKQNLPSKALLILNIGSGHPREEQLKSRDGLTRRFVKYNWNN